MRVMAKVKTVAVLGASGYGGAEVLRLAAQHPNLDVAVTTGETQAGQTVAELYPHLHEYGQLRLVTADQAGNEISGCDLVFSCLPHGAAMAVLGDLGNDLVIDLGGDFRLDSADDYESWYGLDHQAPGQIADWTYGLPELFRLDIEGSRRIANPGCYPTAVALAAAPLVAAGLVEGPIVADAASGTSGAGRAPKPGLHFAHVHEDMRAYKVGEHQHTPEMEMAIARYAGTDANDVLVSFTAHLVPMVRGIHATVSAQAVPAASATDLNDVLADAYPGEAFVDVVSTPPGTKQVRGTNRVALSAVLDERSGRAIVTAVLDNLVKGAAGQAIQNANIALGLPETTGLPLEGLYP